MDEDKLIIRKIEKGTVIDHIPAGKALQLLRLLMLEPNSKLVVACNVESKKLGKKDIIKVEGKFLSKKEVDIICLVAPTATINKVEEWRVVEKRNVQFPNKIEEVMKCPNLSCITNLEGEPIKTKFITIRDEKGDIIVQCDYCDILISYEEIQDLISS